MERTAYSRKLYVRQERTVLVKAESQVRGVAGEKAWMVRHNQGLRTMLSFRIKVSYCWVFFSHFILYLCFSQWYKECLDKIRCLQKMFDIRNQMQSPDYSWVPSAACQIYIHCPCRVFHSANERWNPRSGFWVRCSVLIALSLMLKNKPHFVDCGWAQNS